ncbi:MAG: S-layer homology domain-containing protein [Firmicutes bacterium]|nr:S-layer homology domain-containing protein [Bacillota bacterium]
MKTTRRVFVLLLAAVTLLCMMPGLSFAEPNCKVTATAINNGTVSISGSQYMNTVTVYEQAGAKRTVTGKPADGYYLKCWSTNPGGTPVLTVEDSYTFTVEGTTDLYAIFQPNQFRPYYDFTINFNGGIYQGSPKSIGKSVAFKTEVSVPASMISEVTPPEGKVYDYITVNGVKYNPGSPVMVKDGNLTFDFHWKTKPVWSVTADPYTLDFGTLKMGKITESDYRKVVFTNTGNQTVNVVPETKNTHFTPAPGTITLAPGESGMFLIKPSPIMPGGQYDFEVYFKTQSIDSSVTQVLTIIKGKAKMLDETTLKNPFVDVYPSDEYYNPVLWAYYHEPQITNGIDATHFAPKNTVKRCESVTFLWRASGCPEPSSYYNPFTDVKSSDYFYKPVLWAIENGITKGTSATAFSPNQTLSTAHMVTFLYRTKNPGKDGWYEEAANWAGEDYGGKPFGVNLKVDNSTDCPRGAVVTFLYRCPKQQELKPTHTVIPNALNVREGPGSDYNRIGGVTAGKEVIVVDIIGEWSKIVYGNGYGWVQWKYLKLIV